MAYQSKRQIIRVGFIAIVFAVGFLCGTLTHRPAQAQMGDLGKEVMGKAAGAGGPLGSVVQLGQAISDMQTHVDGLQKNIEVLKNVKSSLGG
jgi:hypothetical protein